MRKGQKLHSATTRGQYSAQSYQRIKKERSEKKYIRFQKRPKGLVKGRKRKRKYSLLSEIINIIIRATKYLYKLFAKS